jgi:triacylglycerol esterase/lipase EstA (alpha/beta hydrolase family)
VFDKDINACPILYSYVDHSGFCVTTTLKFRRRYKELVLVGHSTGGLIIRSAILEEIDATKERLKARHGSVLDDELKKLPVLKSAVRLFAPVHLGAICSGKLAVARHLPVSERLTAVLLKSSPLFQNIQPESKLLDRIRENTETLTTKYGWMRSLRADLLFGYDDAIVTIGKYDTDPMLTKLKDHSHTSICKPNAKYTIPLEFVVDAERIRAKHL